MRIALVSQEYPPETAKGGIGTQSYLKAHGLAAAGHLVHVLSRTTDTIGSMRKEGNLTVQRIPGAEHRLGITLGIVDLRPVGRHRTLGGELVAAQGGAITVSAPIAGTVIAGLSGIPAAGFNVTANQEIFRLVALPTERGLLRIREDVQVAGRVPAQSQRRRLFAFYPQIQDLAWTLYRP